MLFSKQAILLNSIGGFKNSIEEHDTVTDRSLALSVIHFCLEVKSDDFHNRALSHHQQPSEK